MTAPKNSAALTGESCWKVRIVVRGGAIIHVLSRIEPRVVECGGVIDRVELDCITNTEHGDTIGWIEWKDVSAVTWRYSNKTEEK